MQNNVKELLQLVSGHGYYGRLGKLFSTEYNYYFLNQIADLSAIACQSY